MWLWIFLCLILNYGVVYAQQVNLEGQHKFSPGDNPIWSSPEYNDSKWGRINVPGTWQSQDIKPKNGIGWYRIHFTAPANIQDPAISLGRIGNSDEVFLNGRKIGSEGIVGNKFVEAEKVERLYKLPKNLLKFNDSNLLAVRVINIYSEGGILEGNIAVGSYDSLLVEKLKSDNIRKTVEVFFFTFIAIYFVFCLFIYIIGIREREYTSFGIFVFLCGITCVLDSLIFYETGFKIPFIQQVIYALMSFLPGVALFFLVSVYKDRFNLFLKFTLLFCLLLSISVLFFSSHSYFYLMWIYEVFLTGCAGLFLVIRAASIRKAYESTPILLGVIGALLATVAEIAGFSKYLYGLYPTDFAGIFFMVSIKYALITRYVRIKNRMEVLSEKILLAHEDERKRLSREIHDGIGQSLSAIKLNLQIMEAKAKEGILITKDVFPELIKETSDSIQGLKNILMDIRPSFLEEMEIGKVIRWYAEKFQKISGIEVKVQTGDAIKTRHLIKDNIFRICQEALNNIARHSGANCAEITVGATERVLSLQIKDNGQGFDSTRKNGQGLGLSTIKERAELLSGICRIKSSDEGTSIYIEVPVEK